MKEVAAVIVTYNRKELLIKAVEKLQNQTLNEKLDIIIVDNGSTDGTLDIFKDGISDIIYFNTGSNLGGAGGFNYGIKKGAELGYKYLWIMDDDTLPEADALEKFLEADKKLSGEYGFLSGKVLWKDGSVCVMNRQKITKWKYVSNFEKQQQIQYASFVSLFVKTETVAEIGLPYRQFFIWTDDWEYTRRISKNNKCYYIPGSVAVHFCNSNVGADIVNAPPERIERFRYMYRNDVCLYRLDGFEGFLYLFIRTMVHCIRILTKSQKPFKKIGLMFSSLLGGIKFHPEIEYVKNDR